ncbi:MAG TPA: ATP-binding cassette domain-containing protein, partial [Chthoniobacteraceae bacterium]
MALIELHNVTKRYRVGEQEILALDGIDLTIEQGEYASIIGPSGSGKSTLMHLLGCLDTPTTGRMLIDGVDVSRAGSNRLSEMRNQKIGFVFQSF